MAESLSSLSERDEYERAVLAQIVQMPRQTFRDRLARWDAYLTAMWQYDSQPHV